ncbi:hypothetical protein CVT25_001615 [Psilocybe cyanescens]|uniref:Uncharacterized protein n=1 Tax=Psilocybe cyanescens TaxID=93625 RepID=A0A409WQ12_PSICY|nr:hypothetical protein CVT25_001615 [Psilocybe cyanescens]
MASIAVTRDGQITVGPSQASYRYIRRVREVRDENQEYEEPLRVYTPSNASSASNETGGYPQPSEVRDMPKMCPKID